MLADCCILMSVRLTTVTAVGGGVCYIVECAIHHLVAHLKAFSAISLVPRQLDQLASHAFQSANSFIRRFIALYTSCVRFLQLEQIVKTVREAQCSVRA